MVIATKEMLKYFESIEKRTQHCFDISSKARQQGYDPQKKVEVKIARNMAERVVGLISTATDAINDVELIKRIQELELLYGPLDWKVALIIGKEVAEQKFGKFSSLKEAIEVGIRTGFAYHTVGIVAAPLEGFTGVDIKKTKDGKEYLCIKFSGPIRGAGGTAAAFCVILADFIRVNMGLSEYDPSDDEISRYIIEINDYNDRVTPLQYHPSEKEIAYLISHIPVEVGGEPTEKIEVSNYKDLERIETNQIRGGMALVLSMVALKAPKVWKRLSVWGKEFQLNWLWLDEFLAIQKKEKAQGKHEESSSFKLTPNYTYISELVAGRPVFSYPLRSGGFRLRYGRSRTSGFSSAAINPATMITCENFIAIGTQIKVERPGKAAAITSCDSVNGPIVKIDDGSVLKINSVQEALAVKKRVTEIIYLGDILFNYGDFNENGHVLVPVGYCPEWWVCELKEAIKKKYFDNKEVGKKEIINVIKNKLGFENPDIFKNMPTFQPSFAHAKKASLELDIPLHPGYIYFWSEICPKDLLNLLRMLSKYSSVKNEHEKVKLVFMINESDGNLVCAKRTLEILGVPFSYVNNNYIVLNDSDTNAFLCNLGTSPDEYEVSITEIFSKVEGLISKDPDDLKSGLDVIKQISNVKIMDLSGTFIGARMGRPEKAKMRTLKGSPETLFPVGTQGGRLRSFEEASNVGFVEADIPKHYCEKCKKEVSFGMCDFCLQPTKQMYYCPVCKDWGMEKECEKHGEKKVYGPQKIEIKELYNAWIKHLGVGKPEILKGVRGTSSKNHIPEHFAKGLLRAKSKIAVNKDGTIRYDVSEVPLTHFKPKEIRTSIKKLKELGYVLDIYGNPLTDENQILEIKPQDIILPSIKEGFEEGADMILLRVCNFIDLLLEKLYHMKPFYEIKSKEDLVGHLVLGMAPHISCGMVGRIIGFSETQGLFCSPMFHAALRRDCDGDEACLLMLMDAFLNFSREYMPDKRGGRSMDAPLVITSVLDPSEVDDMVLGLDVEYSYPIELYNAAQNYKNPRELSIDTIGKRLGKEKQYEGFGFTHDTENFNAGVLISAYKILPTMDDKMKKQMFLAEKIRAVDENDVAKLVIEKHFLKDLKGNLRKFSQQSFRCVKCNEIFRRPPLRGICTQCGGKIIFTISEGSVIKYLQPSLDLSEKYNVGQYLKQTLELTNQRVESMFGKEIEKQESLSSWFGK